LFEVLDRLQGRHLQSLVGSTVRVLFEGPSKSGGRFVGRSERHEIVHVAAPPGCDLTGRLLAVRVSEANKRSLAGELLELPEPSPRARGSVHLPVWSQ
jgi:tRNA-2-methylthio-N6-dimethylallyladenosine synthase